MGGGDKRAGKRLTKWMVCRPCNFNPIHSLTGKLGQVFASRLGGKRFASWGGTHSHNGTKFLLFTLSSYIDDPDMFEHWPCPRLCADMGSFTRLCPDDVKSQM